jgi:hypothetical protein
VDRAQILTLLRDRPTALKKPRPVTVAAARKAAN